MPFAYEYGKTHCEIKMPSKVVLKNFQDFALKGKYRFMYYHE